MDLGKLICNSSRGSHRSDGNFHLLSGAFYIFTFAIVLLLGYVIIDHEWETNEIENQIAQLEDQLKKLKEENYALDRYNFQEKQDEDSIAGNMVRQERECHRTLSSLTQIKNIMIIKNRTELQDLHLWNETPKGFLHLESDESTADSSQKKENVDGMDTVVGWKKENGGDCENMDPKLDGNDIVIPMDAYYVVYSQIPLYCGTDAKQTPQTHRHAVQYVEVLAQNRDTPKILMENNYQLCDKSRPENNFQISYQKGVYRLTTGDILRVTVVKPTGSSMAVEGEKSTFGVHML